MIIQGSIVALITPFQDQKVDVSALTQLINWHLQEGTEGILICGTTGEAPMLTKDERALIIQTVVTLVNGQCPVIVGVGTASTDQTIDFAQQAKALGADAILVVTPYYVKPTQEGIIAHIKAIHDAVPLPIILYNNPGRTIVELSIDTIITLGALERVVALKESNPDPLRIIMIKRALADASIHHVTLLSGEDSALESHIASGCIGTISVAANCAPTLCKTIVHALLNDTVDDEKLMLWRSLVNGLSYAGNPVAIKYALAHMGKIQNHVRLPLVPLKINSEAAHRIREAL